MVTKDNTKTKRKIYENLLTWEFFNFRTEGYFVEVGANDPKAGSQTWLLERVGWTGILIEPLPGKLDILRKERPKSQVLQVAISAPEKVGEQLFYIGSDDVRSSLEKNVDDPGVVYEETVKVQVMTLDHVLDQVEAPPIDFLSIDVEGTELEVLKGLDLIRWKPKLILIEDKLYNLSKHHLLMDQEYKLVKRTNQNNWYVPRQKEFTLATTWERVKLFRKVYLGLLFRKLRQRRQKGKAIKAGASITSISNYIK